MNDNDNKLLPPVVSPNPLELRRGNNFTWLVTISNPNQEKQLWCADIGETTWLSLEQSTGSLEGGERQLVQVKVHTASLEEKTYDAILTVAWVEDDNPESTLVNVKLPGSSSSREVKQQSDDTPLVAGLNFALYPDSNELLPLAITNPHDSAFEWQATTDKEWLLLDRNEGILQPLDQQTINLTANASKLQPKDYSGKVIINPKMSGTNLPGVELNVVLHVLPLTKPRTKSQIGSLTGCGDITVFSDSGPKLPKICPKGVIVLSTTVSSKQVVLLKDQDDGPVIWTLDTGGATWLGLDKNDGSAPTSFINGTFQNLNDTATINFTLIQDVPLVTSANARLKVTFANPNKSIIEPTTGSIPVIVAR